MQPDNPFAISCRWVMRLAWINLCWWAMSAAGLFITGVVPASVVALQMMRRYLRGQSSVTVGEYVAEWREEWVRSNVTLLPLLILVMLALIGVKNITTPALQGVFAILVLALLPVAVLMVMLAIAILLELSVWRCSCVQGWRNGLLFLQQHPVMVLMALASMSLLVCLGLWKPICGLFFLFSPVAMISMLCMMKIRPQLFNEKLADEID